MFGMAEATLAVTFPDIGVGMEVDTVDRNALENERYAAPASGGTAGTRRPGDARSPAPRASSCASATPRSGDALRDREVGELELRGPSVTPGYYANAEATEAAFHDDWFRTGDLAYLVDGRLVVCGRLKDMIIVGGRNLFPEDIERAASTVDGVRAGNVIAFGSDRRRGREAIIVVAETRTDDDTAAGARCGGDHGVRRRGRPAGRRGARAPGHPAEDLVGQAATLPVPRPLPRRRAGTRLTGHSRRSAGQTGRPHHGSRDPAHVDVLEARAPRLGAARAHPDVPDPARDHVRAAPARVLRAGLQLRRDVRRDPGARDRTGRRALRGRHRPQAAARPVHLRGDVRVLRDLRAVVGAGGRDARRRAHRAPARGRGAPSIRIARGMDRRRALRARDGCLRATRRAGRELRGVHAAVDDGGDPVRATRARCRRGRRDRARDAREANGRGHAAPRPVPAGTRTREARSRRRSPSDSASRSRPSPWPSARASSSTGRCSATVRTSA